MARGITAKTLLGKTFQTHKFDGVFGAVLGEQEKGGIWVIYGNEKNGKTTLALLLAEYLTKFENLAYVSAEEGVGFTFQQNLKRAKIDYKNTKIKFYDYQTAEEIDALLSKRQAPGILILDNATVYVDDIKTGVLRKLAMNHPKTKIIVMAHMEKNEPTTAMAKLAKKLCNVYFRVEGLTAFVGGRCPGGAITIDLEKAMLYHGTQIIK
jgi:ABC-type molybdenum transport system ATPase subunit/photorepair protein PhrA